MGAITDTLQQVLPALEDWKSGILNFTQNGISKEADNIPVFIAIIVFSLLMCFFGLKLIRLWSAVTGLLIGLMAGYTVGLMCGLEVIPALIAGVAAGVILAVLSAIFMSFGNFVFVLTAATYIGISILYPQSFIIVGVCAAIGLVFAFCAIKFKKSLAIIFTAAAGGFSSGFAIVQIAGLNGAFMPYIIAVVLMILGIIVQFFYVSKKANKKIIEKAEKIKQEVSVENEIEAAKSILDQIDTEPEAVNVPEVEEIPEAKEITESEAEETAEPDMEETVDTEDIDPVKDFDELVASEDDFEETEEDDPQKKLEEAMKELERVKKELEDAKKAKKDLEM